MPGTAPFVEFETVRFAAGVVEVHAEQGVGRARGSLEAELAGGGPPPELVGVVRVDDGAEASGDVEEQRRPRVGVTGELRVVPARGAS